MAIAPIIAHLRQVISVSDTSKEIPAARTWDSTYLSVNWNSEVVGVDRSKLLQGNRSENLTDHEPAKGKISIN